MTRLSFHPTVPGLQTAWDSTSLGSFKTCPRKYQYEIIEGWRPRAVSVHLTFGILYHGALERYDHARASGADFESAVHSAVRWLLESTTEVLPDGTRRPWVSDDSTKNRETLVRSVVWYLDHFRDDPASTITLADGKPAVELSFRFETGMEIQNAPVLISGHLDRLVDLAGDVWVMDRKTTKSALGQYFFDSFNPHNQMTIYTIAGQVVYNQPVKGVIIDAVQVGVTFSRFARGFTFRHKTELDEWTREFQHYVHLAEQYALAQEWPKNDSACGMYGGCPFREICARAPAVRERWLTSTYVKRPWDPLQVRGDI